ncbi:3-deoxy-7-phosphoheptulonate synthase [Spirobacillus cienkowskii]|uniref:3-deoxy-7-phosphoheptulonate synthase n=1 Tax=Spirobacillus cienkowskii TaxID=495820 RepID=UPI0030CFEEB6
MNFINLKNDVYDSWNPTSWVNYNQSQLPNYEDTKALEKSIKFLKNAKHLVFESEISLLQSFISDAAKGKIFLLHAGDCAETFESCTTSNVIKRVSHLKSLATLLEKHLNIPVVIIGRIAGQYAKPRSHELETINNMQLPSYRGDIINDIKFCPIARQPNPERLKIAYKNSSTTLSWIKQHLQNEYLSFQNARFFISHESLLLDYESSLTHRSYKNPKWYNYGAHYLWLGERTRNLNSAHVEYLRGISNPIGIKLGPNTDPHEIIKLLPILNPQNEPGKINLITRIGANFTQQVLKNIILKVNQSHCHVTWSCDPMHGNSFYTPSGIKTRNFLEIWNELRETYLIHKELQSNLAGIHLELTFDNVTECIGGNTKVTEESLPLNYTTFCDPRLNYYQSFELLEKFSQLGL